MQILLVHDDARPQWPQCVEQLLDDGDAIDPLGLNLVEHIGGIIYCCHRLARGSVMP